MLANISMEFSARSTSVMTSFWLSTTGVSPWVRLGNRCHRDRVAGIVFMEAIVRPVSWDEWPELARPIFQAFRSDAGEEMVIEKNLFVEAVLPGSILRDLESAEMMNTANRSQSLNIDAPLFTWPRQIPIEMVNQPRSC